LLCIPMAICMPASKNFKVMLFSNFWSQVEYPCAETRQPGQNQLLSSHVKSWQALQGGHHRVKGHWHHHRSRSCSQKCYAVGINTFHTRKTKHLHGGSRGRDVLTRTLRSRTVSQVCCQSFLVVLRPKVLNSGWLGKRKM